MPFFFTSCSSSDEEADEQNGGKVSSVSGVAQKGQFLRGSSITVYALDKTLNATGLSYPTQTSDDRGSFTVGNVNAEFLDIKANGYYFNENQGSTSQSTINLQALAEASSRVNVNLLTTLAYNRIKYLVAQGSKFSNAQSRAQIEVLTALGFGNSTSANFIDMNIANSGDANGILLAASLLIQQGRSVGEISKLISDIAADLEEDGMISAELNEQIHKYERYIYDDVIITNLLKFYEDNKIDDFAIPTYYKFLDKDGDGKLDGTADYIFKRITAADIVIGEYFNLNPGLSADGFTLNEMILSTIAFNVTSDAEWLTLSRNELAENIYSVGITAAPNTGENRTATITFTSNDGRELAKYSYQQKAADEMVPQYLCFPYLDQTGHTIPSEIGVNGKAYTIKPLDANSQIWNGSSYGGYLVEIPKENKSDKYQLYFPMDMISMPDGYGKYELSIPSIFKIGAFPYISQRDGSTVALSNPTFVVFVTASPFINTANTSVGQIIKKMVLSSESPLCGTATFNLVDGEVVYTNPEIDADVQAESDGLYRMTVELENNEEGRSYNIPVLTNNALVHVQCFDAQGELIDSFDTSSRYDRNGRTSTR